MPLPGFAPVSGLKSLVCSSSDFGLRSDFMPLPKPQAPSLKPAALGRSICVHRCASAADQILVSSSARIAGGPLRTLLPWRLVRRLVVRLVVRSLDEGRSLGEGGSLAEGRSFSEGGSLKPAALGCPICVHPRIVRRGVSCLSFGLQPSAVSLFFSIPPKRKIRDFPTFFKSCYPITRKLLRQPGFSALAVSHPAEARFLYNRPKYGGTVSLLSRDVSAWSGMNLRVLQVSFCEMPRFGPKRALSGTFAVLGLQSFHSCPYR